jgi:peptidoglycan/LPS O-acetylase OafA/YrhL
VRPDKTHKFLQALPFDLFYLQEIPFYYGVDGDHFNIALYHTWSLGIEEKFYLLWPLIFFAMLGWQHRQRAITLLRLPVALLLLALFANARHLGPALGGALFPYFHLLLGCAAALLLNNPRVYAALHWLRKQWLAGGITTVFVVAQVAWPNHENWPYYYPQDMLYSLISVLFVMVLSTIPEGRIAKLMSARPLVALGKLSYPIFLIHILAINAAEKIIQTLQPAASGLVWGLLTYGLVLLLTIPVAYVLNRTIGQPLMDIGRRVSARMIQAAAPATTPARLS